MYTEQLRMPTKPLTLLAVPFMLTLLILTGVVILAPLPLTAMIPLCGAMLLEATVGALLVASLSRIRVVIDDQALTVAFRLLFTKRITLARIVSCTPTDARVWGMAYQYRGTRYRPRAEGGRAVLLNLTNGAQVVFASRHADAVCAALRARRPEIARATGY